MIIPFLREWAARRREETAIQAKLDELAVWNALYESIVVVDAETWRKREEASKHYLEVTDWLYAHDVFPQFDREHGRYLAKRFSVRGKARDDGGRRKQNARARRAALVGAVLLTLVSLLTLARRCAARGWPSRSRHGR